jgi:5'(3')-deoxyribonucleotidase
MDKTKLFLDMDGTIINSVQTFCEVYNEIYSTYPDFKPAKWWEVEKYNFSCQCPMVTNVHDIFSHSMFFDFVDFINGNTKEVIEELAHKYNVIICTIGVPQNISLKALWIEKNLPFIKDMIFISHKNNTMNKNIIDMKGGIFIDDVLSNIESSNADRKFIFGDAYEWNNGNPYIKRLINWTEVQSILL